MSDAWALVTGANGFIGARLVRRLVESGERVKALVRPAANIDQLRDLPRDQLLIVSGDMTASHTVYRALANCDRLYHVAAKFSMWSRDPAEIHGPTVEGARSVLEAARRRDLKKIVFTSSVASLGTTREPEPMTEAHAFNLDDPEMYIAAKRDAEQVALDFAGRGLPIVIVNPASAVGPGDWKPTPMGRALLRFLEWPAFPGFPVPARGGISVVDVDDVARGHHLAMQKGRIGERYILGGDNVATATLFRDVIPEVTGYAPELAKLSPGLASLAARALEVAARVRGGEPELTVRLVRDYVFNYVHVSSEKAERELSYTHRPAAEAIGRAVRWYRQHQYLSPAAARRVARAA